MLQSTVEGENAVNIRSEDDGTCDSLDDKSTVMKQQSVHPELMIDIEMLDTSKL